MYLMLQNVPIMEIDTDKSYYHVIREDLLPIRLRGIYTKDYPDLSDRKEYELYSGAFVDFLSHRVLSLTRKNAKKILNAYHFSQAQDAFTKARIAIACKAVSMSDDYWLNDENLSFEWKNVCVRKNHLNEIVTNIALTGSSLTVTGKPETAELSTEGAYAKAWIREENGPYLLKAGDGHNEEKIEVMVSRILDCTNVPHVQYSLDSYGKEKISVSKCAVMNSDRVSRVPADEFYSYCLRMQLPFEKTATQIDNETFYQHCIVDYLISNPDRHMQNWGFFMDNQTGSILSLHPLFDHNNAFDLQTMQNQEGAPSQMIPGKTQKEAALYAIKRCQFHFTSPVKRSLFLTKKQYQSFMERACILGLYQKRKPSLLGTLLRKEEYIPISHSVISPKECRAFSTAPVQNDSGICNQKNFLKPKEQFTCQIREDANQNLLIKDMDEISDLDQEY